MTNRDAIFAPRRGLSGPEAAAYIGVGVTKFYEMVAENRMPQPVRIDRRAVWDIRALDRAFDDLTEATTPPLPKVDDDWTNVRL